MLDASCWRIALQGPNPLPTAWCCGDPAPVAPRWRPPPVGVLRIRAGPPLRLSEVVRHKGPVLRLATGLREQRLPAAPAPASVNAPAGRAGAAAERPSPWLGGRRPPLRRRPNVQPDSGPDPMLPNASLEQLVPLSRRASMAPWLISFAGAAGEVLLTARRLMHAACPQGEEVAKTRHACLASRIGSWWARMYSGALVTWPGFAVSGGPVIGHARWWLVEKQRERHSSLRLLPPPGSLARQLEAVLAAWRRKPARRAKKKAQPLAALLSWWARFLRLTGSCCL